MKMEGDIIVVARTDDGYFHEVTLTPEEKTQVHQLLTEMFPERNIPISETTLPLKSIESEDE